MVVPLNPTLMEGTGAQQKRMKPLNILEERGIGATAVNLALKETPSNHQVFTARFIKDNGFFGWASPGKDLRVTIKAFILQIHFKSFMLDRSWYQFELHIS